MICQFLTVSNKGYYFLNYSQCSLMNMIDHETSISKDNNQIVIQ